MQLTSKDKLDSNKLRTLPWEKQSCLVKWVLWKGSDSSHFWEPFAQSVSSCSNNSKLSKTNNKQLSLFLINLGCIAIVESQSRFHPSENSSKRSPRFWETLKGRRIGSCQRLNTIEKEEMEGRSRIIKVELRHKIQISSKEESILVKFSIARNRRLCKMSRLWETSKDLKGKNSMKMVAYSRVLNKDWAHQD